MATRFVGVGDMSKRYSFWTPLDDTLDPNQATGVVISQGLGIKSWEPIQAKNGTFVVIDLRNWPNLGGTTGEPAAPRLIAELPKHIML